jgi:hypothetical protein
MSAVICSDATTNALAQLAEVMPDDQAGRQRVAELLRAENGRSFGVRNGERPVPPITYVASSAVKRMPPVQVLKLCACFDYQCTETADYSQTEAARIVEAIRHRTISQLPGYLDAEWDL